MTSQGEISGRTRDDYEGKARLVLGISGSPRLASTDFVVRAALKRAEERHRLKTQYFSVAGKTIGFCTHCDYCIRTKAGCIIKDDLQLLYPFMVEADAWIVGSPVYQGNISAQTKAVLDRCRALSARNPHVLRNKIGGAIASGGDRAGGQELANQAILGFYVINEMIPVGGGAFGANLGGSVWSKDKGAEGAVADSEGLKSVDKMVDRLAYMLSTLAKDEMGASGP
jgi:multimeric flavodoxin WrbA